MRLAHSRAGVVYAEFMVAFVPFFLLFLGGIQLSLIAQARIVVQHAATLAVRAAVVSIDDDPVFYDDGKRKVLSTEGSGFGQGSALQLVQRLAHHSPGSAKLDAAPSGSGRLNRVRNAAYLPLSAVAPSAWQMLTWQQGMLTGRTDHGSVAEAVGDAPLARVLTGLSVYGRIASAVTFPKTRGGSDLREPDAPWADHDAVHVRVTYLLPCSVPLVRSIVCRSLFQLAKQSRAELTKGLLGVGKTADPIAQALLELLQAEWLPEQAALYALPSERFIALRGEASLPNQGAAYKYPSELCQTQRHAPGVDCKVTP